MAQSPERHDDELPPDPAVTTPATEAERRIRLSVVVPPEAWEVFKRNQLDPLVLANRALRALWLKHTPQRGPADKGPYAGEILYFQRLVDSPSEVLTLGEHLFVTLNHAHEQLRRTSHVEGLDAVRREVAQAIADLAEWVAAAQKIVRMERGDAAPQIDWEVTKP